MDITIHNDVASFHDKHGIYLMVAHGSISGQTFYFGFQTDVKDPDTKRSRGKGVIFNRWGTRDLANVRLAEEGYSESSGHEGDFVGVRRGYGWAAGDYRLRLAPERAEPDGEWFGLSVTDMASRTTTRIGALKFPYPANGQQALIDAWSYTTIEVYGIAVIRPIDIPEVSVSVELPRGDGRRATHGETEYSDFHGQIINSEARLDHDTGRVLLQAGGLTRRVTAMGRVDFRATPTRRPATAGLDRPVSVPAYMTSVLWKWERGDDIPVGFKELAIDVTIHNDVDSPSADHGIQMLVSLGYLSGQLYAFGFRTDLLDDRTGSSRGRGITFERWGSGDLIWEIPDNSWPQYVGGADGSYIAINTNYDWGPGDYRFHLKSDGADEEGELYALTVREMASGTTTFVGSLKFPFLDGTALIQPAFISAIEISGLSGIRAQDIPEVSISMKPPVGDGQRATNGFIDYAVEAPNSGGAYNHDTREVHMQAGGLTQRRTVSGPVDFR